MLALLFSVQSIPSIQSSTYAIPIAQLYYDAVGRKLTLMCLTVIALAQGMAAVTAFTASSRLFYALARDNAFPLKSRFMYLNRFQAPVYGVWLSVFIGCVISCAYIGSTIAVRVNYLFHPILTMSNAHSSTQSCPLRLFPSCLVIFNLSSFAYSGQIRKFTYPKYVGCPSYCCHRLKERGPFNLKRWSWTINFASLAVNTFPAILLIYGSIQIIVYSVHLCSIHFADRTPS